MLVMGNNKYDVNQNGLKVLVNAYRRSNKKRDSILISGVSIMIGLTFIIFSFLYGKLNTDILKNIREDGITVSSYLEYGTIDLENKIRDLSFVENIGKEKLAGNIFLNGQKICTCIATDNFTYETMIKPAYTNVKGNYPQNAEDIMLSEKTLKYLGITNPRVGMRINLEFYWNVLSKEKLTGIQTFILCGYYTDYHNNLSDKSIAYISINRCKAGNIDFYPSRILIDIKTKYEKAEQIEQFLIQSIPLSDDNQYFMSSETAQYRAMVNMAGGFGGAIVFILLICFSMFIFVYNTLFISLNYDVRQYGLLEVIGVTGNQIKFLIYRQVLRIFLMGCVIGGGISGIVVNQLLPELLNHMYYGNEGNVREIRAFNNYFLVITILLAAVIMFAAAKTVADKLLKMSPIEAIKGLKQTVSVQKKVTKREKHYNINPILNLAFGNILRDKKKFVLTVVSLTIGCEIALGSCVLALGTDPINRLSQNPDFEIGITQNAIKNLLENNDYSSEKQLITEATVSKILYKTGLSADDISNIYGYLPIYDKSAQNVLSVLNEYRNHTIIVQKINSQELGNLLKYITKYNLIIDTKEFVEGTGTIVLHNHLTSVENKQEQKALIGKSISLYDIVPQGTKLTEMNSIQLKNCGYLDISISDFPNLKLSDRSTNAIFLLVTEKQFKRLSNTLTRQLLKTEIKVSKEQEIEIKNLLKNWIKQKNLEYQTKNDLQNQDLMYLVCNSDVIQSQRNYRAGSRIVLMTVSAALLFIGIINYINTMVMNILTRKKELIILESIGFSRKRLRLMLIVEGALYSLVIIVLLLTIGNLLLFLLVKYIQCKIVYFKFIYPFSALFFIALALVVMCILIPFIIFGQHIKESISLRIKQIEE